MGHERKPAFVAVLAVFDGARAAPGYVPHGNSVDLALTFGLSLSLGLLLASHVALSVGLALLGPWYRGVIAFVVPPLAPFWGYHGRLHRRALIWIIAVVVHLACLTASAIGSTSAVHPLHPAECASVLAARRDEFVHARRV